MSRNRNLIAAALAVLFLAGFANGQNLIFNPSMEIDDDLDGKPDGWAVFDSPPSNTTTLTQVADAAPGNGTYSALIGNDPGASGDHWFWQYVTVEPEQTYVFDFWFKGNAIGVHFENGDWPNHMSGGGTCFWEWWNEYTADPDNKPNPETDWIHATHYDFQGEPWLINTLPGQTTLMVLFIPQHGAPDANDAWIDEVSLVLAPFPGDVDGDRFVGGLDWNRMITNWGATGATREMGDLSGDGTVGGADFTELMSNWGQGTLPTEPAEAVPEPGTLLLLAGGLLAGLTRRR